MDTPKTIMIYVRAGGIGDSIMKLPFIGAVRRAFPDAHITWTAGKHSHFAEVLHGDLEGVLDEVLTYTGVGVRRTEIFTNWRPLKGRAFDLVIDTQRDLLRAIVVRRIRHRVFISPAGDFLISDRRPPKPWQRPAALIDELAELVSLAAGKAVPPTPIPISSPQLVSAAEALLPEGPTYVGLAPGAGKMSKCWPLENFIAVARAQAEKGRVPVFLLGPEENDLLETLRNEIPEARFPDTNARGPQLVVALATRMAAAVANDSGTGHMLAAGSARLVSLYHRPHAVRKFRPGTPHLIQIQAQEFGGDDIGSIPVEAVVSALEKHIAGGAADT